MSTVRLFCADGHDQQSCGDGKIINFNRSNSEAILEIWELRRHMEDLNVDEVKFGFLCLTR